jgi:hypothetical protein
LTNIGYLTYIFECSCRGLYIGKCPSPPGGGISADVILGKKYEKAKRKKAENVKKKEDRGKKMRKGEVKR